MEISNFKPVGCINGDSPLERIDVATVDVTTGRWWWKKTVTREIYKECLNYWRFSDTGEFTPGSQVEHLVRQLKHDRLMQESHEKFAALRERAAL